MPVPILATKLFIPPPRPSVVSRPHLVERLQVGLQGPLTLISAPAGAGKTTLLSQWRLGNGSKVPTAWLSLDSADNDLTRFLQYLSAALDALQPGLTEEIRPLLQSPEPPNGEAVLTLLINRLSGLEEESALALDDFHLIDNPIIHTDLTFLLEHLPPHLHLVVLSRADPPLPLARLRARGQLVEIRLADLRFSVEECTQFMNQVMGLNLTGEQVAALEQRTEGWVAGLQLAALSMQGREDVNGFVSAFTGSNHYIVDYLAEEVLTRQPEALRQFLLKTSIPDRMTGPLCDALTGEQGGEEFLKQLERANLFVIPLDDEHRWYRYNHLFSDLLRLRLEKIHPGLSAELHGRACTWFEEQGLIADAIRHALMAKDWERVIRLIKANVFALLELNELNSVTRQLDCLPLEKGRTQAWLWIVHAWLSAYTGQLDQIEAHLAAAEAEWQGLEDLAEQQSLQGYLVAIRAYAAWIKGDRDVASRAARNALECLPPSDYLMRCQAATILGLSLNNISESLRAYEQALSYVQKTSVNHVTLFARACQAYTFAAQGRLREAHTACLEAIQSLQASGSRGLPLPTLGTVYVTLSRLLIDWNDLEGAVDFARKAVDIACRWGQADASHLAYSSLARALFACGEVEEAFDILRQARQVAKDTSSWFESLSITQEVEMHLEMGNPEAALACLSAANYDVEDTTIFPYTSVQVFLAQKQFSKAEPLLSRHLEELTRQDWGYRIVHVLIWQAITYHELKQDSRALASLERALELAAPENLLGCFLRAGAPVVPLLHRARSAGIWPDFIDRVLVSFDQKNVAGLVKTPVKGESRSVQAAASSSFVEPLSGRELEVLKLLAQGCPDKKIAETLVIARETVHKHLKNIYGKLGVHSRTEAVARARELDLL